MSQRPRATGLHLPRSAWPIWTLAGVAAAAADVDACAQALVDRLTARTRDRERTAIRVITLDPELARAALIDDLGMDGEHMAPIIAKAGEVARLQLGGKLCVAYCEVKPNPRRFVSLG